MRHFTLKARFSGRILWLGLLAALTVAAAPGCIAAQQPAAKNQPQAASATQNAAANPAPKSEEEQMKEFLHGPGVQWVAHVLHLSENATMWIFVSLNFAVIALAIVIPLTRLMPRILRKRSLTLRHSLDEARKVTEEARQRMSAVEAKLAGLDHEIAAFRAQVEQESRQDEQRIKAAMQEESERIVAAAEQEIGAAAAHARRALRHFAADLAIDHATKQMELTPETDRALLGEFVGQVANEAGTGNSDGKGGKN